MKNKIDLFKLAIVIIGCMFLWIFNSYEKNGRYNVVTTGDGYKSVIDTRTGALYYNILKKEHEQSDERTEDTQELIRYCAPIIEKM